MSTSFETLGLCPNLINALKKEEIYEPFSIQTKAIPLALENKDIIGQSQTGSGKTLAYLLPLFEKIKSGMKEMQVIILAPTHELVIQINKQIELLSKNSELLVTSTVIIGGVNIQRQKEKLKQKPNIIVGSTGRILELIKMKKINCQTVKTIVIDEGDRLLDKNNISDVKAIIKSTMKDRQLMIFSATISPNTLSTAKELMNDCVYIQGDEENNINPNITHMCFLSEQRDKIELLRKLIASIKPKKSIVFLNKSDEIDLTAKKLNYHNINAFALHGSTSKEDRQKGMEGLRNGKFQFLIASDLAARGLDVKDVTHIFNMDLPPDPKDYLHRIGRTGRVNKSGTAISIVNEKELSLISQLEKKFQIKIIDKKIYRGKIWDVD